MLKNLERLTNERLEYEGVNSHFYGRQGPLLHLPHRGLVPRRE